jgi:hypothetical protein
MSVSKFPFCIRNKLDLSIDRRHIVTYAQEKVETGNKERSSAHTAGLIHASANVRTGMVGASPPHPLALDTTATETHCEAVAP